MITRKFLEGSGFIDSNIALTVDIPDVHELIEDPEWFRIIENHYAVENAYGYYRISHNDREVIFINEENLIFIENQLHNTSFKRLIIIFRKRKTISDTTKSIMTQNSIPLLDLPIPKLENEYAKSIFHTSTYGNYITNAYESPQVRFWYDLFIGILSGVIASFIKF